MSNGQEFAVCGLGVTAQGKLPDSTPLDVKCDGLARAMEDAGLSAPEIDGLIMCPGLIDKFMPAIAGEVVSRAGLAPNFIWEARAGGNSAAVAVGMACMALDRGLANYVAVVYGDKARTAGVTVGEAGGAGGGSATLDTGGTYGMYSPGADHALGAQRHMKTFGTTREQLGAVALSARSNANRRPEAYMYGRELTMESYLEAPLIAEPLGKFDYCLVADGGCSLIITTADRAKAGPAPAVEIAGIGASAPYEAVYAGSQYDHVEATGAKDKAFTEAGISLGDIDVAQIYDCFTITVLMALESYGFCPRGEAGPFVEGGGLSLDGDTPVNTAGGELAWSYLQGFTPLTEGLRQLRSEGGDTQVPGAAVALVTAQGGLPHQLGSMDYQQSCIVLRSGS